MEKLPIALQVYSIREEANQNFEVAMKKVKEMGYDGVELAGLYGNSPESIKKCLDELELLPISAHVSYQEFLSDLSGTVKRYSSIGCKYLVIPYLNDDHRYGTDKFMEVMKNIPIISEECRKKGITLLYHNHDFEFARTVEGNYVLDFMYQQLPKEYLEMELDTCWVKKAGENPTDYIRTYSGRCPVIHLKDFVQIPSFDLCPVGYGVLEVTSILEEALAADSKWIIVEQDWHKRNTAMENARLSIAYLKSLGW